MDGADRSIHQGVGAPPPSSLTDLSQVLWRERETLELVVFKLEEQRLLLVEGQDRWVVPASREIDVVLDQLSAIELNRAVAAVSVALELDVEGDATLRDLAVAAPSPWPSVLERHQLALVRLAEEIVALSAGNRKLLSDGLATVRTAMSAPGQRASTRLLVDAAAFTSALSVNDRVLPPSLIDAIRY